MPTVDVHYKAFAESKPAWLKPNKYQMQTMQTINQAKSTDLTRVPTPDFAAFVGIDWADELHALSLCAAGTTEIERATLEQTPEALAQWANNLRTRFPNGKIAVALEQARGALLAGLSAYEHIVLYPVNPKSMARFREALYPSRSKDDPVDADLLLQLLCKHRDHLRPWQPDTVETRQLALLSEHRRGFVDHRTALSNQLLANIKAIFPQALSFTGEDLGTAMATDFLKKWPTLQALQKVKPATLRQFYYAHNSRSEQHISQRLALLQSAIPLTSDPALLAVHSLAIQTLAAQLAALRPFITRYDEQIAELFAAHPDAPIFDSLPGAGPVLAPRLLASLGTDRSRFPKAESVSCYTGIAPVTERSGKNQYWVHIRWSCPKFIRQSWHEFASASIKYCAWAAAAYRSYRKKLDHHEAVRKLAFKWQRIIWRMWQENKPYDDTLYLSSLEKKGINLNASPSPSTPTVSE
jgi:transposase